MPIVQQVFWRNLQFERPPCKGDYLVVKYFTELDKIEICVEKWQKICTTFFKGEKKYIAKVWGFKNFHLEKNRITHWMPLPQTPDKNTIQELPKNTIFYRLPEHDEC
jgi:hypothetical protein